MKLNPQQAPLYGDCIITILLSEDDQVGSDDAVFYLVFTGSAVQHCTSIRKLNSGTLETIAPGHDCCETVKVSLCAAKEDHPILVVAEDSLQFVQDEAYDAAQFLATCAGNQQALNFTRFLDRSRPPAGDVDFLDEKVTLAFRHLKLPTEWNVLGAEETLNENVPRETLIHFAVRLGLLRLTWFLLQQPGGRGALRVPNSEGATPVSLALERGYQKLHQLLTEEGASEPDSWSTLSHTVHSGAYCVKHHRGINVYTLTTGMKEGAGPSMESDIALLRTHIRSRQRMNVSERSHPGQACKNCSLGTEAEGRAAPVDCDLGETMTEGAKGDPSAPLQIPNPACPEDGGCRPLEELLDRPEGSLGPEDAENPTTSVESKNIADRLHKEEEEELPSGALLEGSDRRLSLAVDLQGAAAPPSCGNTNEGAGMTSPDVALQEAGPSESCCFHQEVQSAAARGAESATQPLASCEGDSDVGMGQSECKSCTGAGEAAVTTARPCGENREGSSQPSGTGSEDVSPPSVAAAADPAASFLGDGGAVAPGETAELHSNNDPDGSGVQAGSETPGDGAKSDFTKHRGDCEPPPVEGQSAAPSPGTELVAVNTEAVPEVSPKHGPAVTANGDHWQRLNDADADAGTSALDLSGSGQNADSDANVEEGRPSQLPAEPEAACGDISEAAADVQGKQNPVEGMPLGPGTASPGCGASAEATSLDQGPVALCLVREQGAGKDEQESSPVSCTGSADASGPPPCALSPAAPSPVKAEPFCQQQSPTGSSCELDRFSKSAQEFIALASALLVEEAIQQAQLILAHGYDAGVAPVGREAPLHPKERALPSCGKGTGSVRDCVVGTPSAIHHRESKQHQEVAAAAAAATRLTGIAEQGNPVFAAEAHSLVDHRDTNKESRSSLQLSESGPELPGEEEAEKENEERLASIAVVQPPCCDLELGVNESDAGAGLKGGDSSLAADENVKVGVAGPDLRGPGLPKDASLCTSEAPSSDATLNAELSFSPALQAASPPGGVSDLMEAPLVPRELPPVPSLPREVEEVDNVSPRLLLQPIAEEPPCDGDPGSEMLFLAREGETRPEVEGTRLHVLTQSEEGNWEGAPAEPELLLPPCPAAEGVRTVEADGSVQELGDTVVDSVDKTAKKPDQATLVAEACCLLEPLTGNLMEIPPLLESQPEARHAASAGSILNGEADFNLQPDGLGKSAGSLQPASSSPVADALEMKTEEEADFSRDLSETAASEGMINRENWCPVEPSPDPSLLKPKRPCSSTESDNFLEVGLSDDGTSSQGILKRGSGSEPDLFPLPGDGMDEVDFGKPEEEQSGGDSTSSSSSADDTISLERNSSLGSDISLPQALGLSRSRDPYNLDGSCFNMATCAEGPDGETAISGELEEELDSITEVPPPPSALRNAIRPLSPFRRHSWGPGKNGSTEAEINHRSSMRVLGDAVKKPPTHRRSLSWCPSGVQCTAMGADFNGRSYSLEGLAGEADGTAKPSSGLESPSLHDKGLSQSPLAHDERGSLVSLTEELELEQGEMRGFDRQIRQRSQPRFNYSANPVSPPLTKSMSLMTIAQVGPDSNRSYCGSSSSASQSVCEEGGSFQPPSPSRKDLEGKSGTKVSRTFSYLRNKMSSGKKSKEKDKDKEKLKEREKDSKDKDKKMINGHLFSAIPTVGPVCCQHCQKPCNKDSLACANCGVLVHKSCKENMAACSKVKLKRTGLQPHDSSSLPTVIMRSKSSQPKERPRSAILAPDENTVTSLFNNRRSQQLQNPALSKSVSIQNIAGVGNDENMLHNWKILSHSTDSLNKICRVNESMESLTDEGADMNEGQLMGDFEMDSKQLEAQSWSQVVDSKFLQQQKKDVVKRQDVIYELMQTEMHHVRTLKIMSDVYSTGMVQELQYEQQMVEKVFPCLDDLLNIHSQFFQRILERKKESLADRSEKNFVIKRIGDILVNQFSGENAERMKKTYGKFCGHHNEAVNYFKDLHSKEKRFQAFIKKKMSSSVVRRLGIPECILLVTQRITKYPVLLQRILQYTKENDIEHQDLVLSLNLVKEVITAVNSKVSNYEKKMRLNEIYTRTDSKSIMRMKSGQMFAREDLRRRKFVQDGPVSLRNAAGRLKEVQAVLLSDVLIFLQEKDQKYVFASLDQKSTVISLKKLIVREVAHEEKGLFLISMGGTNPEMVEVHASLKEERNSWIQIIQDTINTMDKEEDEGVPSEMEEEKRVLDTKARELKEQLQQKDQQIITLLEEKEKIFRDMTDCSGQEDSLGSRMLFRANTEEAPKGESVMKSVINEVELLQGLVSRSLGSTVGQQMSSLASEQEGVGPISLPRRAETFGGFDSHQMNVCKGGEKDEGDDVQDLRRTESDSVLKKGGTANLMFVLKRNNEQVLQSITHLHSLLGMLQAVVVQQDTYIEDQKRALSRSSTRPNSLIEQEKQRSLEKQRQELSNLKKLKDQHQEVKRRWEREWEAREKELAEQEARLAQQEEQVQQGHHGLEKERAELQQQKVAYQLDLEHLRAAQKQLEKETEQLKRDMEQISQPQMDTKPSLLSNPPAKLARTPSLPVTEDSKQLSSSAPKQGHLNTELSVSPKRNSLSRTHKEKGAFHLIGTTASSQTNKQAEGHGQAPNRLFGLAKPKEKKEKKKKGKGHRAQQSDAHSPEAAPEGEEIFC